MSTPPAWPPPQPVPPTTSDNRAPSGVDSAVDVAGQLALLRTKHRRWGFIYDEFHDQWWAVRARAAQIFAFTPGELDRLVAAREQHDHHTLNVRGSGADRHPARHLARAGTAAPAGLPALSAPVPPARFPRVGRADGSGSGAANPNALVHVTRILKEERIMGRHEGNPQPIKPPPPPDKPPSPDEGGKGGGTRGK
jgi:hypothetical protein